MNVIKFLFGTKKSKSKKTFKEVHSFLIDVPHINRGGCGIAALAMYDAAVEDKLNPKIVYCYNFWLSGDELKQINDQYKIGETRYAASCSHIFVKIGKKYIHAEGVNDILQPKDYDVFDETITREHLVNSIKYGGWNYMFNRKKYLPQIEEYLGYKLW